MKFLSFLKIMFLLLAFSLFILFAIFLLKNKTTRIPITAVNNNFEKKAVLKNIKKENIEKMVFNPAVLQWNKITEHANWSKRDAHTLNVFKDKLWIFGGVGGESPNYTENYSDIWYSENGKDWVLASNNAPWGPRRAHNTIVFKDKIWILGGVTAGERYLNDVWSSEDGINWIQVVKNAPWSPRKGFGAVVFQDKIWVIGGVVFNGVVNDIWSSEDGKNWSLVTNKAEWSSRYDLAVEAFKDKIWLVGGVFPGLMGEKDIWESKDGKSWVNITKQAVFPGRHGHCLLKFRDYLFIIGGWSGYGHGYNDTWYSEDGIDWKQLYKDGSALWKGREDLACAEFEDKLFLMGGMKSNGERTNDVWQLSDE